MINKRREWLDYYHDRIMNFPLDTEAVWDKEFEMRDFIMEKEYGIINFCNYPLYINHEPMGYYNSIDGNAKNLKLLYLQIKSWGYDCYYQRDKDVTSKAYIIFPKNVVCEIYDDLKNKLKNKNEVSRNEVLY